MPFAECTDQIHQMIAVIVGSGHEVAAAHIDPLEMRKQMSEIALEAFDNFFEVVACRFAQCMEVQTVDKFRKSVGEIFFSDAEAGSGKRRII